MEIFDKEIYFSILYDLTGLPSLDDKKRLFSWIFFW